MFSAVRKQRRRGSESSTTFATAKPRQTKTVWTGDQFALRVQPVYDQVRSPRLVPCSSLRTTVTNA